MDDKWDVFSLINKSTWPNFDVAEKEILRQVSSDFQALAWALWTTPKRYRLIAMGTIHQFANFQPNSEGTGWAGFLGPRI